MGGKHVACTGLFQHIELCLNQTDTSCYVLLVNGVGMGWGGSLSQTPWAESRWVIRGVIRLVVKIIGSF